VSDPLVPRLPPAAEETIQRFLRAQTRGNGGAVVGMSGGIDSAVVARLARDALGPERVLGVLLPDAGPSHGLVEEARAFATGIGVEATVIPLAPALEALRALLPGVSDRVALGNLCARVRMTVLYGVARERRRLVLGTGNKSELLLGYFTKYGDGGADLLPIGDLYKTEVRELAERLDVPRAIRERAPSAGFWEGQTDEGELGLPYRDLDRILVGMEQLRPSREIAELTGIPAGAIAAVTARVRENRHKRRLPPIPKLGLRTIGLDWRD
jgi:NAD+ synthase